MKLFNLIYCIFLSCVLLVLGIPANAQEKRVLLRGNISINNQIVQDIVFYEIPEEIDLHGLSVHFPKNSILKFTGGKFKNGVILGTNITIDAPPYQILDASIKLDGQFYSPTVYVEWFGAKNDRVTDCTDAFLSAINMGGNIQLARGEYLITKTLTLKNNVHIVGNGSHAGVDNYTRLLFAVEKDSCAINTADYATFSQGQSCSLENLIIEPLNWVRHKGMGIDLTRPIYMRNVTVQKFPKTNLYVHHDSQKEGPYNSVILNCHFQYSGEHGVVVGRGGNSVSFINCMFLFNGVTTYGHWGDFTKGDYDGFFVSGRESDISNNDTIRTYGYSVNNNYPKYSIENLTVIGGTASHNSRFGWNFSDFCSSTVNPGYAEKNLGDYQMFIGNYVNKCTFLVNRISISDICRQGSYYRRQNTILCQGRLFSTSTTDNSYRGIAMSSYPHFIDSPYNEEIVLMEGTGGRISLKSNFNKNILSLVVPEGYFFSVDDSKRTGTFSNRPANDMAKIGQAYFCTDRFTAEGGRNGMIIYYVGDGCWVDALGRLVK